MPPESALPPIAATLPPPAPPIAGHERACGDTGYRAG